MGIYLFNRETLARLLDNDKADFGKHIIPDGISSHRVFAHVFQGYWQDVGTIQSFFEANLAMCDVKPSFSFFDRESPVYTRTRFLPPSRLQDSQITESLIADGCVILRSRIDRCVVGLRSFIGDGCRLKETVIMGCDYYSAAPESKEDGAISMPHMSIGRGSKIERAIIDKNVRIGDNCTITNKAAVKSFDGPNYYIRDGIVIIPKNSVIPPGTTI
jgi:glucose-1-phosphate adenylyltransferase